MFQGRVRRPVDAGCDEQIIQSKKGNRYVNTTKIDPGLYIRMGQTKRALLSKPIWFDSAYKLVAGQAAWGPGARSAMLIWRSTDGGENFKFRSMIDLGDDWGAPNDGRHNPNRPHRRASAQATGTALAFVRSSGSLQVNGRCNSPVISLKKTRNELTSSSQANAGPDGFVAR